MLQRTPGTFLVSSKLRGPAPLNTALGLRLMFTLGIGLILASVAFSASLVALLVVSRLPSVSAATILGAGSLVFRDLNSFVLPSRHRLVRLLAACAASAALLGALALVASAFTRV